MMNFSSIDFTEIIMEGPEAGRFSFSFEPELEDLVESITAVGLINPPLIRRVGERLEIVCGYRRLKACIQLRFEKIPAIVYEGDELSDEKCLWLSLIDNEWSGRLSTIEKAIALRKFCEIGYPADRLASEIAPHLNVPPSTEYVEKHLQLLSLNIEILRAIHRGEFGVEQAFLLLSAEPDCHLAIFGILQSCKANLNESRELISLTLDVAAMKKIAPSDFIGGEIQGVISEEPAPRKRLQLLRDFLISQRYPMLSAAEASFRKIAGELALGGACRIDAPKYFEGNDIAVTIRAADTAQLNDIIQKLTRRESAEKLQSLFSILHGSESA